MEKSDLKPTADIPEDSAKTLVWQERAEPAANKSPAPETDKPDGEPMKIKQPSGASRLYSDAAKSFSTLNRAGENFAAGAAAVKAAAENTVKELPKKIERAGAAIAARTKPKTDLTKSEPPKAPAAAKAEQSAKTAPETKRPPETPAKPAEEKHLSDREVMEHTASIWQYKSIADDGTEQHSEYHEKRVKAPFAEIIGARVRGKKHKHDGTNCDDYFETALTEDCAISVVCDGAGSRTLSRIGARVSAETAAGYLKSSLTELFGKEADLKSKLSADMNAPEFMEGCGMIAALVRDSAREAFAAQQNELKKLSVDEKYTKALGRPAVISDLSCTFLAAVVVPLEINGARQALTVSVQIGDGCICTIDSRAGSESCLRLIGEADSGKFSGETDFISEKNIVPDVIGSKTRVGRSTADIIMLMTDGVADDYFPAQHMMKRLYLDLCLNGILPMAGELTAGEDPAPIRYRSVSMSQQSVALQYAKQLLNPDDPNAINALWDKREMLRCHSLEAFRMNIGDSPEERLRVWLDNYNERGSFDDRAITVIRLPRDEKDDI
ncbi:MAG: protein phosphatase 2C domain-containing protein [Oscillospiraceae bacterium]|nr:protein phosphatase 2C domain-containing protein [Oscillospiraceae bacterium]